MIQQTHHQRNARWSQPSQPYITLRSIRPDDAALIDAMHRRLSATSLYYRYLQPRRPSLDEISAVCRLHPTQGAGLVAAPSDDPSLVVGVAYYVRKSQAAEPTAEPGILVEDIFQDQGVGRRLWQRLQQHAQQDGVHWLHVFSPPNNERMTQLVQGGGWPYAAKSSGDLNEYLVTLNRLPDQAQRAAAYAPLTVTDMAPRPTLRGAWHMVRNRLAWNWKAMRS